MPLERGYYVSFAGNVTYPKASDLRAAAAAIPRDRLLVETDSPYLAPQAVRGTPNEPANVVHTLRVLAEERGETFERPRCADARERDGRIRTAVTVAPKKSLGQHFLVDENILGVVGRLGDLAPDDVVLEVGPGLGVLTRFLADRVRFVHAVELDRSLEPALLDALGAASTSGSSGATRSGSRSPSSTPPEQARLEPPVQHRHAARRRDASSTRTR